MRAGTSQDDIVSKGFGDNSMGTYDDIVTDSAFTNEFGAGVDGDIITNARH